jgi:ketosteroid isomerase-like protein
MEKHVKLKLLGTMILAPPSAVLAQPASDTAGIRAADHAWSAAFNARDLNAAVARFAPEGRFLAPNEPAATTPTAIRNALRNVFAVPDMKIGWSATWAYVASSGEVGYTSGTYTMSWKGKNGQLASDHGNYVTVWRRQPTGRWTVVLDTFASDQPAALGTDSGHVRLDGPRHAAGHGQPSREPCEHGQSCI